ncbi:MAG: AbrB/MazE/SpoVT family DNA-binding domain-containing protein [Calditrichaceae bacterium]|nr:type II toxin-antitoxin system VapB family antitoxin [Calditrichia bacterium]NUQ44048.1 AbrB/MazE/SpoVT family DNA-binding domain-containing protein [Calditrichaceae bacterium]
MTTAKLFKSGKSQAVRLPRELQFPGEEVYLKKIGNAVLLLPKENAWQTLIDSLELFSNDFILQREQLPLQRREEVFG